MANILLVLTWISGGYQVGSIPAAQAATQPLVAGGSTSRGQQVDQLFASFIGKDSEPGGAVIVIQKGKVLYKAAYGLANLKSKTPLTPPNISSILAQLANSLQHWQ
ncbi:MAG: hypothetical protein U0175_32905 [Caldilineaceae bacterium]